MIYGEILILKIEVKRSWVINMAFLLYEVFGKVFVIKE